MKITKGELVELTSGEYSDFQRHCWMRAQVSFDTDELIKDYLVAHPSQRKPDSANISKFIAWLAHLNYMIEEDDPGREWFLGSYSNLYVSGNPWNEVKAGDFFK